MNFPNLLIKNIGKLVLASKAPMGFRKGPELARYPSIEHAYLTIQQGRIQAFGPMGECPADPVNVLDAGGGYVLPSFVDCHTHLVFAAWREQEFSDRIRGLSYQEISAKGGGILNSARRLADLSEDELFERSAERLVQAIRTGTGALEIKSGYGLSTESELKILRVIRRLKLNFPIPIQATFLGAHSYPLEYRNDHAAYIKTITTEMIPQIAKEQLAEYCDVFCEQNFFSPDETDTILEAAGRHGLKARVHTNQFTHSGGIDVALKHRAVSVDHLELCSDEEIEQLKNSSTHPVLLPAAAFFMNLHYPPARKMIDRGLGIILATDFNPGTSPSTSMPFVWSLGCIKMKLLPEEALQAMTINPAHNMGIADQVGSIETGKWANLMITQPVPSLDFLPYSFGNPWLAKILIRGNPEF